MKELQEKLNFLLDKYSVERKVVFKDLKTVTVDGTEIPILQYRSERRFKELKNIANDGTLKGISVMRVARIVEKGTDLDDVMYRELDLCIWILQDLYKSVMAFRNDNVINIIATTQKGIVCTIEISATLNKGEEPIDKHEIISERGIACDTVVDAQLKQDSIYLFSDKNAKYTDVDFELYGLSIEEIAKVRFAFEIAQRQEENMILYNNNYIHEVIDAVNKSVENGEKVVL